MRLDMKTGLNARLDCLAPVRPLRMSRRALTGRITVDGTERAGFESSLERDWLICLDFDPAVSLIREQPFSILYDANGRELRYTPDILAQYLYPGRDPIVIVYEVKPIENLAQDFLTFRPRFKQAVAACRDVGWRFKIVTEKHIRTPFLKNAKFLRKYRGMAVQQLYQDQLLYSLRILGPTTPQALLAMAYTDDERRMAALTELWRMVANREIATQLELPLNMQSRIWIGTDDE